MMKMLQMKQMKPNWHLRILKFCDTRSGLPLMPGGSHEKILGLNFGELEEEYVELKGKKDFYSQVVKDLFN
jgi:hypothetical protein